MSSAITTDRRGFWLHLALEGPSGNQVVLQGSYTDIVGPGVVTWAVIENNAGSAINVGFCTTATNEGLLFGDLGSGVTIILYDDGYVYDITPGVGEVRAICYSPASRSKILAAVSDAINKTIDRGSNWTEVLTAAGVVSAMAARWSATSWRILFVASAGGVLECSHYQGDFVDVTGPNLAVAGNICSLEIVY